MTDLSDLLGSVAADVQPQFQPVSYPPVVAGRVLHIDADFICYQVSAESAEELDPTNPKPRKSFAAMCHNAKTACEYLMRAAGAESYVCHTTPSGTTKGGRPEQAIQKEYQANRSSAEKPEFLDAIRAYVISELGGKAHLDQEADDGLCQALYGASDPNLVVITSKDKDLRMCNGLHLDQYTHEIVNVQGFGSISIDRSKSVAKLVGYGTKFFWAQCLMGDVADNIQGLPALPAHMACEKFPTAAYTKLVQKLESGKELTAKQEEQYNKFRTTNKPCGVQLAFDLLEPATNDKEAFEIVLECFVELGLHGYEFKHWQTGEPVTATQALLGDMKLLWMRRTKNPDDVIEFIKEINQ